MKREDFDDIRPYYDEEIPAAMQRIADSGYLPVFAEYVFPGVDTSLVRSSLRGISSTREFQEKVMRPVNEQIIRRSITELTYSGLENVPRDGGFVMVSNHRDIMMDASLINYIFFSNGLNTSEITFGANLMSDPVVVDIGRSNKMFKVMRGGNLREFYNASRHLSDYIAYTVTRKGESVWIAQRNGRTKDGNDTTDQGIISMFCSCDLSGCGDKAATLAKLRLVPVTISYEWEPCDLLKIIERYKTRLGPYIKQPGEDLNSILNGILSPKGRVHFHFSAPLDESRIAEALSSGSGHFSRDVADYIDRQIYAGYKLYPANYIACDLRSGKNEFRDRYTDADLAEFNAKKARLAEIKDCLPDELESLYLNIYANNVTNFLKVSGGR